MTEGTSKRVVRICLTGSVTDFSLYVVWVAIPYKAISLGATPAVLGLLPAVSSGAYVLTTLLTGRMSDRISRLGLARVGAVIFAAGCLLVLRAQSIGGLLAVLPAIGLGMGFFWPPVQAALADEGNLNALENNIGLFNVFWSSGKALGFLVGGSVYAWFGARPIFVLAAGIMLVMTAVLPRRRAAAAAEEDVSEGVYERTRSSDLRTFLYMAWVANAIAFGVGNTMNIQYPKFMMEIGFDSRFFGVYLFAIFIAQTLTFFFLRSYRGWKLRRLPIYAVQAAMGISVLVIPLLRPFPVIVLSAIPLGLGLGLAYHASITYSLASHAGRGQRAGIHESLLGAGNFMLPMIGGLLASAASDLRIPYWFCGFAVLAGLIGQEAIWNLAKRRQAQS